MKLGGVRTLPYRRQKNKLRSDEASMKTLDEVAESRQLRVYSYVQRNHRSARTNVAVGIRLSPYPPRGSVRADFPHTALASGSDAQTARGIRMADTGRRQPAADEPLHSLPQYATF